jgi:hypothetical protein
MGDLHIHFKRTAWGIFCNVPYTGKYYSNSFYIYSEDKSLQFCKKPSEPLTPLGDVANPEGLHN